MAMRSTALLGHYAGLITRAVALLVDIIFVVAAIVIANVVIALPFVFFLDIDPQTCTQNFNRLAALDALFCFGINAIWVLIAFFAAPVYFIFSFAARGQTIGKYVMGVRVVRVDGRPMNFMTGLVRYFGYWVSLLPLGLGFFWVVVDQRRLAFHDHLAKTCVVYSWRAYGDDYLLERVTGWFRRRRKDGAANAPAPALTAAQLHSYDLVTLAVPSMVQAEGLLGQINDLVGKGVITVDLISLVAKDSSGSVGVVSLNDLSAGSSWTSVLRAQGQLLGSRRSAIAQDLPSDSFSVVVMLPDQWADELVKRISRQTAVAVRRYDLGAEPDNDQLLMVNG